MIMRADMTESCKTFCLRFPLYGVDVCLYFGNLGLRT